MSRAAPGAALVLAACVAAGTVAAENARERRYGLGTIADPAHIARIDIAIGPDGAELPAGRGTVAEGRALFARHCAMCHGASGREGPDPVLVGGRGTLAGNEPLLTIGSFWPYATTLYDYIYRAMPFLQPGSLAPGEVYALCAYLLFENAIIDEDTVVDRASLPRIRMPNRDGFIPDPRPDVVPSEQ